MKRLLFVLLLCAIGIGELSAQEKGEKFFGGKVGIGIQSIQDRGASVSFTLSPEVGFFVADNFRIGGALEYGITSNDGAVHSITIGPRIAYYVHLVDRLYYVPELGIYGAIGITDGYGAGGFGLNINLLALEYRPTAHLGLSLSLVGIHYLYLEGESLFGANLLGATQVGFRYYF